MSDTINLCTCRACNKVYIDTNPGPESKSYPIEVVKKFKLQHLVDNDCPACKPGESELRINLDATMIGSAKIQRYINKRTTKRLSAA